MGELSYGSNEFTDQHHAVRPGAIGSPRVRVAVRLTCCRGMQPRSASRPVRRAWTLASHYEPSQAQR